MRGILWCLLIIFGSAFVQAQTIEPDFEFDFTYPTEALSIVGVYANDGSSCVQVMITGQGARREEFRTTDATDKAVMEVPLQSLCFVVFSNLDRNKRLELRLSPEVENVAQLSDRQIVNSGLILEPSDSSVILWRDNQHRSTEIGVLVDFFETSAPQTIMVRFDQYSPKSL